MSNDSRGGLQGWVLACGVAEALGIAAVSVTYASVRHRQFCGAG